MPFSICRDGGCATEMVFRESKLTTSCHQAVLMLKYDEFKPNHRGSCSVNKINQRLLSNAIITIPSLPGRVTSN